MKPRAALLLTLLFLPTLTILDARLRADDAPPLRRPLDLPSGGAGKEEEEEDAPEAIEFYGAIYEGDAFFWCLDRSSSMAGERLAILKHEVSTAISTLSFNAEFGIVTFNTEFTAWQPFPAKATAANKFSAREWVYLQAPGGGTLILGPGVMTVNLSQECQARKKSIIVVGDGMPGDAADALQAITTANTEETPIHTLLIQHDDVFGFMEGLAEQNSGTFRRID